MAVNGVPSSGCNLISFSATFLPVSLTTIQQNYHRYEAAAQQAPVSTPAVHLQFVYLWTWIGQQIVMHGWIAKTRQQAVTLKQWHGPNQTYNELTTNDNDDNK